jgi:hypothetical protein
MEKYTLKQLEDKIIRQSIPKNILKSVYDKDDNVLFGNRYIKGKVSFNYVPGEYTETGRPYIVYTSISYDSIGNKDLPEDSIIMEFKDLPAMFPDNKYS